MQTLAGHHPLKRSVPTERRSPFFERVWKHQPWGRHWDSPPFAFVLQDADANSLSTPGISNDISSAVAATIAAERAFDDEFPARSSSSSACSPVFA